MLILAVYKKLAWHHHNVITGKWRVGDFAQTRTYELAGKTLGIVGLGTIGKKVAKRAQAFDMHVQYYDIVRLTEHAEDALDVRFVLFPELLRTSDVVSLHVPLSNATRGMMGAREFATMKRSAILINTCRGPVVDEAALQVALASGQIAAAGLDVMVKSRGGEPSPVRPREHHHHAALGRTDVGELGQGVSERVRQRRESGSRAEATLGDSRAAGPALGGSSSRPVPPPGRRWHRS